MSVGYPPPALSSRRGIGKYPPLSAPFGAGLLLSPGGEAVIKKSPFQGKGRTGISQADRLTCRMENRSESGAIGRESQSCRSFI